MGLRFSSPIKRVDEEKWFFTIIGTKGNIIIESQLFDSQEKCKREIENLIEYARTSLLKPKLTSQALKREEKEVDSKDKPSVILKNPFLSEKDDGSKPYRSMRGRYPRYSRSWDFCEKCGEYDFLKWHRENRLKLCEECYDLEPKIKVYDSSSKSYTR
jgi:hypothetical protein